jgi:hypothetical protein
LLKIGAKYTLLYTRRDKVDFTWEQLERLAYADKINCDDFQAAEYKYFMRLKDIYACFRNGLMDQSKAESEKKKLMQEYRNNKREYDLAKQAYKEWNEAIKKSDYYIADINKATDPAVKLSLCLKCIAAITGNKTILEVDK